MYARYSFVRKVRNLEKFKARGGAVFGSPEIARDEGASRRLRSWQYPINVNTKFPFRYHYFVVFSERKRWQRPAR